LGTKAEGETEKKGCVGDKREEKEKRER